jgi:hypothetical protein
MEVDPSAWAYFDFRIDLQEINQTVPNETYFATKQPGVGYVSAVTTNYPQFPLIVNVAFNITVKIVNDTRVEVKRKKS